MLSRKIKADSVHPEYNCVVPYPCVPCLTQGGPLIQRLLLWHNKPEMSIIFTLLLLKNPGPYLRQILAKTVNAEEKG